MRAIILGLGFLLLFGTFSALRAEEAELPVVFKGRYGFSWSGIPIGSMYLTVQGDGKHYAVRAVTKTTGLVRWFAKHTAVSTAEGKILHQRLQPLHYHSDYTLRGKSSSIDVRFSEEGAITGITLTPPARPGERPVVEWAKAHGAVDPVTSFMAPAMVIPRALWNQEEHFSFNMFDGKRLSKMVFTPQHPATGTDQIRLTVTRTPLEGFRAKELRKAKEEPAVDFYYTDKPAPIRLSAPIYSGTATGVLKEHCDSKEACLNY